MLTFIPLNCRSQLIQKLQKYLKIFINEVSINLTSKFIKIINKLKKQQHLFVTSVGSELTKRRLTMHLVRIVYYEFMYISPDKTRFRLVEFFETVST